MGWDEYRRQVFARQIELGLVPAGAELSDRDPDVPLWEPLGEDAKRMYTRQMEVFGGFMSQTDHHIGRVIDFIEQLGRLDDTIVICLSDNGASAEGGEHGTRNEALLFNWAPQTLEDNLAVYDRWGSEDTFNHYAWGWTWAGDTPFRRWKRETYRGGITDPFLLTWPGGIQARGEVRTQYLHAIDLLPTLPRRDRGRPAEPHPRGGAVTDPGHQLRAGARRCRRARSAPDAVLRDVRPPVDLSRRLEGGVSVPGSKSQGGS